MNCGSEVFGLRGDSRYCARRECKNARQREWRKGKGGYPGPKRQELINRVEMLKALTPCMDCGNVYPPECMDFDHLGDKVANVSKLVSLTRDWPEIQAEIDKCDLVCANCHRIRTRQRTRDNNDKGKWETDGSVPTQD